jgi:hypothetical protein
MLQLFEKYFKGSHHENFNDYLQILLKQMRKKENTKNVCYENSAVFISTQSRVDSLCPFCPCKYN